MTAACGPAGASPWHTELGPRSDCEKRSAGKKGVAPGRHRYAILKEYTPYHSDGLPIGPELNESKHKRSVTPSPRAVDSPDALNN
jgi:hypothetical protein